MNGATGVSVTSVPTEKQQAENRSSPETLLPASASSISKQDSGTLMTTGHQSVKQNLATRFDICIEENGPKMNENRKKTYQFQQFAAGNQGRAGRGGGGFGRGGGVESPETIPRPHGLSDDLRLPETMKQFASTLNGGAATGPTDGFTLVGKPKPIVSPDDKKLIGIQMNRTVTGDSRIGRDDIANFFSIVESIDPNAIVFSANKNVTKPISVKRMQSMMPMDLYGFLDIKTTEWGRKDSGQRKTTLSFWLYTHVIKENIKELRQDERIQQFLSNGKRWLQPTRLTESRSRVIAYIEGKKVQAKTLQKQLKKDIKELEKNNFQNQQVN